MTQPRKEHDYYSGLHTFAFGPDFFEVRWVPRDETCNAPGWYWQTKEVWHGPFTSSREAFRDAKDTGPEPIDTVLAPV